MRRFYFVVLALALAVSPASLAKDKLHVVAVSHLDTQWWWDIQTTITECIPATFEGTFDQLDKYPDYVFSWEGANRYKLLKEYYPDLFARLLGYVIQGRWFPAGSSLEGGDVNIPSPEALLRNFLYGNRWFEKELGHRSLDVFLPDCFGFGAVLPTVAAHCGLKGFSTQKLAWGSAVDVPFEIGVWRGVDGSGLVSALTPGSYIFEIDHDVSHDPGFMEECSTLVPGTESQVGYRYFGIGDQGGPAPEESVAWLQKSIDSDGPVEVASVRSDQLFRDLTAEQVAALPDFKGELILTQHGTGAYTSQALMKRLNRRNELLADAAERANAAAAWLGAADYPHAKLTDSWERFLVHHFHDDLTGTGIPEIYQFSWNDEYLALNRLATALTHGVGGVASRLDTQVEGIPVVVFNPLSVGRLDAVEAVVRFPGPAPQFVRVFEGDSYEQEAAAQIIDRGEDWLKIVFIAVAGGDSYHVYDVRPADGPCDAGIHDESPACGKNREVWGDASEFQNSRFRVSLDEGGNVVSVFDKDGGGRELLSAPLRLAMYDDWSGVWPAWEILYKDISVPPREVVRGPAEIEVVENGPARFVVEVRRKQAGSEFIERHRLDAGTGDRFETETIIRWNTQATLLKAEYPLAASNPKAPYDVGVGTIERWNNTEKMYEVPAQQWAAITDKSKSFGVAVLNDCKYGWDKPDDSTLRTTFLHLPFTFIMSVRYGQDTMDIGEHRILSALTPYSPENGSLHRVGVEAARLNQPLLAFQTDKHAGVLGRWFRFVRLTRHPANEQMASVDDVSVKAVKKAEDSDEIIVRVADATGKKKEQLHLGLGNGVVSAREVNGMEDDLGQMPVEDGYLRFDLAPFQLRSFALTPAPPGGAAAEGDGDSHRQPEPDSDGDAAGTPSGVPRTPAPSRPVPLPFNIDVVSPDLARMDGKFANIKDVSFSLPAEQWPVEWVDDGVRYVMGPAENKKPNAVSAQGQVIPIDSAPGDRLYILAAADKDREAIFKVGDNAASIGIQAFSGFIGQWTGRVKNGEVLLDPAEFLPPFLKLDPVAWYSTHRHRPDRDDPYMFTYLYRYVLPVPAGATSVSLPNSPGVIVVAMTLVNDPADRTVAAGELHDGFDPLHVPVDWGLMQPPPDVPEESPEEVEPPAGPEEDLSVYPTGSNGCAGCVASSPPQGGSGCILILAVAVLAVAHRCKNRRNAIASGREVV
jgi:alpha-mannosidase